MPTRSSKNKNGVQEYMDEMILFGGIQMTRGEAIAKMLEDGTTRREVDYWLVGYNASPIAKEFKRLYYGV